MFEVIHLIRIKKDNLKIKILSIKNVVKKSLTFIKTKIFRIKIQKKYSINWQARKKNT